MRQRIGAVTLLLFVLSSAGGCVTVAEFRKLEERVINMERGEAQPQLRQEVAEYVADIDSLRDEIRMLEGRVELTERTVSEASTDARKARSEFAQARTEWNQMAARGSDGSSVAAPALAEGSAEQPAGIPEESPAELAGSEDGLPWEAASESSGDLSEEIRAYRVAHAAWQSDANGACVDRFRKFLQTYPASSYADDAAFWMADCHFKQADFKNAVLRFDDVVRNYPSGNKAPDALYRQGESLLKLGPGYREAARRAFERVITEYPDSERAEEAQRQLRLNSAG